MKKSFGDMIRSLGLMAVIIAVMVFIGGRYLVHPTSADRMPAADYVGAVSGFRQLAPGALAPTGLPQSWRANATDVTEPAPGAHRLHVGWALPGARYAGLDEATGDAGTLISLVLGRGAAVAGHVTIAGVDWERRVSDRGETAYTRRSGDITVVVTGNASDADLQRLAASLH